MRRGGTEPRDHIFSRKAVSFNRVLDATELQQPPTMAVTKGEDIGESSTSAAKKVLKANTNGVANYELPW